MTASVSATLLLSRQDICRLLSPVDCYEAVEAAFLGSRLGQIAAAAPLHMQLSRGGIHAKAAVRAAPRSYAAIKINSNFPENARTGDLPTIQGVIVLYDGEDGRVLAVMDSSEITLLRTAAATALAAQHLARKDARSLCLCGCGQQAPAQVAALTRVRRFECGYAWDRDIGKATTCARAIEQTHGIPVEVVPTLTAAARYSDVIVTCTTARTPFLDVGDVSPGAFVAAVGADAPDKNEIAPRLMARATVVADVLAQCLVMGDLHHAVEAGALQPGDIHGELADVICGAKPGRTSDDEIVLFDSTGTAIEDVACAALAYERALGIDAPRFPFAEHPSRRIHADNGAFMKRGPGV